MLIVMKSEWKVSTWACEMLLFLLALFLAMLRTLEPCLDDIKRVNNES